MTCSAKMGKFYFIKAIHLILLLVSVLITGCSGDNPVRPDNSEEEEPNVQFEQYGEPFENVPEIRDVAMYEVNPKVFSSSKDLNGITQNLERIKELGINTVWVMPIYPTGEERSVGSPYAIKDFMSVNPEYGTLEDLRNLTDKAHSLDMAVILDWVANHTAWDHEWITGNPQYYQTDSNGNIIHPPGTNWMDVAQLNFSSQDMRREMINAMKYWVLEANIDGFRFDYATGVPGNFWSLAIDELREIPNRELILFAETANKELLDSGFDMIFGWPYYGTLLEAFAGGSADGLDTGHLQEYSGLQEEKEVVRWVTNHDQHAWDGSPIEIFGGEQPAISAFVAATYSGGVPLLYNGQELGITTSIPFFEGSDYTINWDTNSDYREEYLKILNYRAETEVLRSGEYKSLFSDASVAGFMRYSESDTVFTFINTEYSEQTISLPKELQNSQITNVMTGEIIQLGELLQMDSYQYLILNR